MISHANRPALNCSFTAGMLAVMLTLPIAATAAAAETTKADTYTWSAELVALDEATGAVTLKSSVVSAEGRDLSGFTSGDLVTIRWSGQHDFASGVRSVIAGAQHASERFFMPATFVASEGDGRYVSFTVTMPAAALERIKALKPGDWVTATATHTPADRLTAVVAIRPYNDLG